MVEHGAAVAVLLGIVHEGADVLLLAVIGDSGADDHGDVICGAERETPVCPVNSDTVNRHRQPGRCYC